MTNRILVATAKGLFAIDDRKTALIADREVSVVERDGDRWWALVDGMELWQDPAGGGWRCVAAHPDDEAVCLHVSPAGVFVGTEGAHLELLDGSRIVRLEPFERVDGRKTWYTPWGGPPDVRSMASHPDGTLYVNVHVGGIPRSDDGGATWRPTIDIDADVHQVCVDADHGLVFAAAARGLAVSADRGETWELRYEGFHARYCRAVVTLGDQVFVTASTGPHGGRGALYRAPVVGGTFERCAGGLPEFFSDNIDTHCVDARDGRIAFGGPDRAVYVSADDGRTWDSVAADLPPIRCVALD